MRRNVFAILGAWILLLMSSGSVFGQVDTLFWFAAPELTKGDFLTRVPPAPQTMDRPIHLRITAASQPATVTVTQPAGSGAGYMPPQTINVAAGGTTTLDLTPWIDFLENKPPNQVLNYGLKISSTAPISAYYEIVSAQCLCAPTIFVLKGQNALGTDFWIPSQNWMENGYPAANTPPSHIVTPAAFSSFDIVATENNTTVTITPSSDIVGHPAGTTFTIVLNVGQTYSATATSYLAAAHLQGSRVTSDKPIAITYKDDLLRDNSQTIFPIGCGDPGGDQIVPTPMLGTEYIAIKGVLDAPGDQLFITATQNGTVIRQDGVVVTTLNAGQTLQIAMPGLAGTPTFIQSSQPVTVLQLTGYGCEMDVAIVPKNNCESGSTDISFVRAVAQPLYLHLTVAAGSQGDFLVNGNAGVINAANFVPVPGTGSQWYAARVLLSPTQFPVGTVIRVQNTSGKFHMGVLNGQNQTGAGGMRFGYFSNFGQIEARAWATSSDVCEGQDIELKADPVTGATYTWSGPGGFASSTQNPTIVGVGAAATGIYSLRVDVPGCISSTDTVMVKVFPYPVADLGRDTAVCDTAITLQPTKISGSATYLWSNGTTSAHTKINQSGKYWIAVTENGCTSRDTIDVNLSPQILVDLGPDTGICIQQVPYMLDANQPAGTTYVWSNGTTGSGISISETGTYWVRASRFGCFGSDTIKVTVVTPPNMNIGRDSSICEGESYRIGMAYPNASYLWNTGASTPFIEAKQSGIYVLEMNIDGCRIFDTVNVEVMQLPDIDLGADRDICPDEIITLDASYVSGSRYLWNTGDTTSVLDVSTAGMYYVDVYSALNCRGGDTIVLTYYPKPTVTLRGDTTVCDEVPLEIRASAINADSIIWSNGVVGEVILIRDGGEYIATGVNKCGEDADTILVRQLFCDIWLPNAFTPNGDGLNDIFRILGNIGRLETVNLGIFNRWGERVFVETDPYKGWDGYYKGVPAQMGTYVYLLEYSIDGKPYKQTGNFHLLR